MKIIVTGAKGQLAKEIIRLLSESRGISLFPLSREDMDITDFNRVYELMLQIRPDIVINCAAMTNVDLCEAKRLEAWQINARGAANLAVAAESVKAEIVHISTDYVFDGKGKNPYTETDNPYPINFYGKTKLLSEQLVRMFNPKYYIVRTAWLYGEGNNFINTMLKLGFDSNTVLAADDQLGSPTSSFELSRMIIKLIKSKQYGLYHGVCSGGCSRFELVRELYDFMGFNIKIIPVSLKEFPAIAPRPHYTILDNSKICQTTGSHFAHWKDALHSFLSKQR